MMYSDTETITTTAATSTTAAVTTTVTGTNTDFRQQLGLHNQWFPAFHVVIRPQEKQKIRFDFYPLYYKQSATLSSAINFNGQTFAAGDAVTSSLYWNEWELSYEYDFLTFERGYVGGAVGANLYSVSGQIADSTQGGTAGVHIPMPGLGVTGRYYLTPRFSATGSSQDTPRDRGTSSRTPRPTMPSAATAMDSSAAPVSVTVSAGTPLYSVRSKITWQRASM